jgi:NodT family efflux transporter outer membrane factor (OMF) lipoprotein
MLKTSPLPTSSHNVFSVGIALALLSACSSGPDFKSPRPPDSTSYTIAAQAANAASGKEVHGERQTLNTGGDIPGDWWTLFQSPQLNALIERALKSNPSIESAQAALRMAQESVIAQQGFFAPSVSVSYSPSRNKLAGNSGGNSPGPQQNGMLIQSSPANPAYYNFHTAQLSVGYAPDIFGLNRRLTESAQAQAEWQATQLQAARISLVSNVVGAALQEAELRAQIAASDRIVAINRENLDIMRKQLQLGFVAEIDVLAQEALLAQSEQTLPALKKQLEQTRDLIRALAGNFPDQDVPETFELSDLHLPEELPLSLPSKLVEQRPDVRAAEAQLHSASAQYGVTVANKMPQFMVSASVGGMASSPEWMFRSGGTFFSLTGNISQIIFDGGTLRAKSRAAEQALIQAGAQYRSTVISALQNVADTLHAINLDGDAYFAAVKAEQASKAVLELTRKQYVLGYVSYQNLLSAEQSYQLSAISLVQAQSARFGDTAALYLALGGGWWNHENSKGPLASASVKPSVTVNASGQ